MNIYESKKQTTISFFVAMLFAIIIFLIIMLNLPDSLFSMYEEFFSRTLPMDDKIFILGSSHILAINPNIISTELEKNGYNFLIYNLGNPADDFEERERTTNMIIKHKPKIVVFGIEPRGFETQGRNIEQNSDDLLPVFWNMNDFVNELNFEKESVLKNPKFALIRFISELDSDNRQIAENQVYPNTPFFDSKNAVKEIADFAILDSIKKEYVAKIEPKEKNSNLFALKKMINELQKNEIKVIVFVTPHSQHYIDSIPEHQRKIFQEIVDDIANTLNVKIYSVYDKYASLNVWSDHTHLAINEKTEFYSKDIANFIKQELES